MADKCSASVSNRVTKRCCTESLTQHSCDTLGVMSRPLRQMPVALTFESLATSPALDICFNRAIHARNVGL